MNNSELFKMIQGNFDVDNLVPLKEVKIELQNYDEEYVKDVCNRLNIDFGDFYFNPFNMLNPYVYLSDVFYFATPILTSDEMFSRILEGQIEYALHLAEEKDYTTLLTFIDKPARIYFLNKFSKFLDKETLHDIIIDIYLSSEYGFQTIDKKMLKEIILDTPISAKHLKKIKEEGQIKDNKVTIYRGEQSKSTSYKKAYSWSLKFSVAKYFATRFSNEDTGVIYKTEIDIDDIAEYIGGRNEYEIIVDPNKLGKVEIQK